jgi:hypothetical protein
MPEAEALDHILTDILPNAGVAGLLALVMFHFYRKDRKESEANWKGQTEMLLTVVKDNTAAITKLSERLEK